MSLRSKHLKLIGAAGAAALTVGAMASPALAAGQATVNYTCSVPAPFAPATPSAVYNVVTAPATMAVGQPLATTATFTLDAATTGLAAGLGWSSFKGKITTTPTASQAGLRLSIPKTALGAPGNSTVATATGSTLAGSAVTSAFTFVLGNLGSVSLTGFDSTGANKGTVTFPTAGSFGRCNNNAGTTTLTDGATPVTTKVVKDSSKTKVSASYSAKKKVATGKAKVTSKFGTPATGKVKFTLKKGTHKIKTITGKIKKGVAKASFTGVKKAGKYSITGKYAGSSTLTGSKGKATFTVK